MSNENQTTEQVRVHGGEILVVISLTLLILGSSFIYTAYNTTIPSSENLASVATVFTPSTRKSISDEDNPFKKLSLGARAAYVYDLTDGKVLYKKNADMILPLASLTKIMTANTVSRLLPENSIVSIKKDFLKEEGDIQLTDNEQWTAKDLLDYTLTISSNDGAVALAAAAGALKNQSSLDVGRTEFIAEMNTQAQEIGLTHSTFYNESGLDQDMIQAGAYGTAQDMAKLFEYTLKENPEILEPTRYATVTVNSYDNLTHIASNTNSVLNKIPNILGSKTGFTQLAGGNLVIAYDVSVNRPIIAVILGSTYTGRFDDMLALVDATNQYIALQNEQ